MTVTIYHNPACGTSRNVLGLIRNSGIEAACRRRRERCAAGVPGGAAERFIK
jgi:arsenate reductase-like glutaredoxin family protein